MSKKAKHSPEYDVGAEEAGVIAPKEKDRFVSKGEILHRWTIYLGIDSIWNAISGVAFSYWGNFTQSGKKLWSEPVNKGFEKFLSLFIKNEAQLAKSVGKGYMFASIIAGGAIFTVPPLMVLEKNKVKKPIIEFYDRLIYGKEKSENDPKIRASHEHIGHEPKKGFLIGNVSRYMALAPLLAIVLIPSTQRLSNKYFFRHIEHASDVMARKMGFSPASFKKIPLSEAEVRWQSIHENAAMDVGLELPYAFLHYIFYGMLANMAARWHAKRKHRHERQAHSHEMSSAAIQEMLQKQPDKAVVSEAVTKENIQSTQPASQENHPMQEAAESAAHAGRVTRTIQLESFVERASASVTPSNDQEFAAAR